MQQQFISFPQTQYRFPAGMPTAKIRQIIQVDNSLQNSNNPALRRLSVLPEPVVVMIELPIPQRPALAVKTPMATPGRKRRNQKLAAKT